MFVVMMVLIQLVGDFVQTAMYVAVWDEYCGCLTRMVVWLAGRDCHVILGALYGRDANRQLAALRVLLPSTLSQATIDNPSYFRRLASSYSTASAVMGRSIPPVVSSVPENRSQAPKFPPAAMYAVMQINHMEMVQPLHDPVALERARSFSTKKYLVYVRQVCSLA